MAKNIRAVRGMHDILPNQTMIWQRVESILKSVLDSYGYSEIRLPIVEKTELFKRSIGEVTDIVEKEMYTFEDRNGDSLTLRPEGTVGCLRACLEHGLLHNQIQKIWYQGPMFRHERPQKGRYRQFYQIGVEAYGMENPDIDAELILLSLRLWKLLGINSKVELQLNSLGNSSERAKYREDLIKYFNGVLGYLDGDSLRRLRTNPLRILDSRNENLTKIISEAPSLLDYLGSESERRFSRLKSILDEVGISYTVNSHLVRGLDYYSHTVFEWAASSLGAQGTVCAGGRYDGLAEQLGGRTNSAVGFALGMERLIALLDTSDIKFQGEATDVFMIRVGEQAEIAAIRLAEELRDRFPDLKLHVSSGGGSFKSQFKKADNSGAAFAFILGDDEVHQRQISIKPLRTEDAQQTIHQEKLIDFVASHIA